jgi:hypothetical protein
MSKPALGILVGGGLGILDGVSAALTPEARPILLTIVIGSTIKGIVTGGLAGLIARWKRSMTLGLLAGLAVGLVLSALAAIGQPDHYLEIVLPGMLLGLIVGFVTQRYPQRSTDMNRSGSVALGLLLFGLVSASTVAIAQPATPNDPLSPVAVLVGRWTGTTEGKPGNGTVEREYTRILGSRFVQLHNRSVYPAQEKNPKEKFTKIEVSSASTKGRKRIVLRQFHIEGFVSQYVLDAAEKPGVLVFTTEAIENIPAGWRARETYIMSGPDQLEEVFELAEPGKDFELYSRTRLTRVQTHNP